MANFVKRSNLQGTLNLFVAGAVGLTLLSVWGLGGKVDSIINNPKTLVERSNGDSLVAESKDPLQRSPRNIKQFVRECMVPFLSWNPVLTTPDGKTRIDQGHSIQITNPELNSGNKQSQKVTTPAWAASFCLAPKLREEYIQVVASKTPQQLFVGQGITSALIIDRVGNPIKTGDGQWKLSFLSHHLVSTPAGSAIAPFNRTIELRAVALSEERDLDPKNFDGAYQPSEVQALSDKARRFGLEVTNILEGA